MNVGINDRLNEKGVWLIAGKISVGNKD